MIYGYVRTSKGGPDGSDPENQRRRLLVAGVSMVFEDAGVSGVTGIATRQGWRALRSKTTPGDKIVVVALDRLGRRSLDVIGCIRELHDARVGIRTLSDTELFLNPYLSADPDTPEAAVGAVLVAMLGLVAQMERDSIARRTRAGLDRVRAEGGTLGRPKRIQGEQAVAIQQERENGASLREISRRFGVPLTTIKRFFEGE